MKEGFTVLFPLYALSAEPYACFVALVVHPPRTYLSAGGWKAGRDRARGGWWSGGEIGSSGRGVGSGIEGACSQVAHVEACTYSQFLAIRRIFAITCW